RQMCIRDSISPDSDKVRLKIDQKIGQLSKRTVSAKQLADAAVVIDERSVKTEIVLKSGETAVIGGLMKDIESEEESKVPVLGDIPILGWLFKARSVEKRKSNLIIFITPTIVRSDQDNRRILEEKIEERIDYIQKYLKGRDPYGKVIDTISKNQISEPETSPSSSLEEDDIEQNLKDHSAIDEEENEEAPNAEPPAGESF
ncbi:MAG: hypothetical protein D6797_05540, partial [Bdellovibrio sp.]